MTANNYQLEHEMCLFILCIYVLYVHGNVHDLHLHYREYQILMRRNGS